MRESIKVNNAALSELDNKIILRGELDNSCLHLLQVDRYQRGVTRKGKIASMVTAMLSGVVLPDIELGMRGGDFTERGGAYYLQDPVYIVDGLQRTTACRELMQGGTAAPRLGCTIHFNTTEPWERLRFKALNDEREKLSANISLRNLEPTNAAVANLYALCTRDKQFALFERVSWEQSMRRGELVSAISLFKVVGYLHSNFGPSRHTRYQDLAEALLHIQQAIGPAILRDNVRNMFDIVDQCWGLRTVTFGEHATHLRTAFLVTVAELFSYHGTFWRDKRLFAERDLVRKLRLFPVADPEVVRLASATGKSRELLYQLMVNHINSGKRTKRLVPQRAKGERSTQKMLAAAAGSGARIEMD